MRHRVHTFKIGRSGAHRRALLANMAGSLLLNGEIRTTVTKAKEARRFVDKLITLGKKGDLHRRRLAAARLRNKESVQVLFDEVAAKYADRAGGYTRIIRLGTRIGDGAEMCLLQLVGNEAAVRVKKGSPKRKDAKGQAPKKTGAKGQPEVAEKEKQDVKAKPEKAEK